MLLNIVRASVVSAVLSRLLFPLGLLSDLTSGSFPHIDCSWELGVDSIVWVDQACLYFRARAFAVFSFWNFLPWIYGKRAVLFIFLPLLAHNPFLLLPWNEPSSHHPLVILNHIILFLSAFTHLWDIQLAAVTDKRHLHEDLYVQCAQNSKRYGLVFYQCQWLKWVVNSSPTHRSPPFLRRLASF